MELILEIQRLRKDLDRSIKELRRSGMNRAQTERDYKLLLRTECLKLRAEGMAIGMIDKICYGIPSVAEARFERDVAESIWTANIEAINSIKLQLRLAEQQLQREWGANG